MRRFLLLSFVALLGCDTPSPSAENRLPKPNRVHKPARVTVGARAGVLNYRLLHTGGAQPDQRTSMIVAMHGLGDQPEHFRNLFTDFPGKARIVLLEAPDRYGSGFSWFPIRVRERAPEKLTPGLRSAAMKVSQTINVLLKRHPTKGKPVVTGFSQGGMLSFAIAIVHGGQIAGAVPLAGWLPEPMWPVTKPTVSVPIVALHGAEDRLLPISETKRGVQALKALGVHVTLVEYPGVGHHLSASMRARLYRELRRMQR